ncbi:uncharacterized protein [Coffea arabica]|uniref:PGG domain-containing protein n=1 Tax=Coffea arabica TaxID=13443 RepID=A0ABM4VZP2_COFAR
MKPKAFRSGHELSPLISWIYDLVPVDDEDSTNRCSEASFFKYMGKFIKGIRQMTETKQSHVRAVRLVKYVCKGLQERGKEKVQEKEKEKEQEKRKGKDKAQEKGKGKENEQEEGKEQEKGKEKEEGQEKAQEKEGENGKEGEKEEGKAQEKGKEKTQEKEQGKENEQEKGKEKEEGKEKAQEKEKENGKEGEKEEGKAQEKGKEKTQEKEQGKENEQEKGKEKEKGKEEGKEEEKEMDFVTDFFIPKDSTAILHLAVEHGVFELVEKCLKAFPDLIWYVDKPPKSVPWRHAHYTSTVQGSLLWNDATQHEHASTSTVKLYHHGTEYADTTSGHWKWHEGQYADTPSRTGRLLLHVAIEHRRVEIFNYLTTLIGKNTKAYADLKLEGNNNSLHLAANLAPTPQLQAVPGPAFQMQREFQWFRAVEELVYDELKTVKNLADKTPRELFFNEHKDLLKDAKEWMKDTSNSCMVVATLVATVAFAAMITVPGGNNSNTGVPILARTKLFVAFSVSNALSMVSSAVSLLMFLSIQTSRYTEGDFLDSLPKKLLRGLLSLFIAIATMMISFGTAIGLSLQTRLNWSYIPITIIACVPVIIFTWLQLPLLLQAIRVESGPGIFQGQRDRKIWFIKKIGRSLLAYDRV